MIKMISKRSLMVCVALCIALSFVVLPVSAAWPFEDITSWGNSVYQWIVGIPDYIGSGVGYLVMAALYPIVLFLNLAYNDITYLINSIIDFLNIWILMPKTVLSLFVTYTPSNMPSVWLMIFSLLLGINCYFIVISIIKILKHFYQLIPKYLGG